jgi:aspartyl-tRNA synthetase
MDLQKLNKNRTLIKDVFSSKNKNVEVVGWVSNTRDLSKVKFIILKDISGIIQVTGIQSKTPKEIFDNMEKISRESVVYVKGSVVNSKQAPGGKEIIPEKIEILSKAEDLPIDVSDYSKTELPKRLDYRFLDFHRDRVQAIFKIQSEIANSFREFFYNKNFTEVFLPSIISSSSEGGTELFPTQYFEKKAYLAQSPQLYKQMTAISPLEKVFTITPVWRAEKHNTVRHLNESRQMDIEVAFADQFIVMKEFEESVKYIVKKVIEKCKNELELLDVKLKIPKAKYLSYEEAIKKVGGKFGDDFTPQQEKKLCSMYKGDIIFTHSWPSKLKPFYIMPEKNNEKGKLSGGFDALYLGSEISSGGQRIHIPELLEKMLKSNGLKLKDFKSYIDSFRFGAPPHAGWSIGLERFTQNLLGIENIREVVLFPRDRDRVSP